MSDLEYRGWRIQSRPNEVPDADGWRVYVKVMRAQKDGTWFTQNLNDPNLQIHQTKEVADQAGIALAKAWTDHEEPRGPKGGGR